MNDSVATVDLRSDTVTQPSPAMRQAMANAEVADDVLGEDPTVIRLQERVADLFGREAALLVPSGTQGNLVSLLAHGAPIGSELVLETHAHIGNSEQGGVAAFAGLLPRFVPGERGVLDRHGVEGAIRTPSPHNSVTRLLALENTSNLGGGTVYPAGRIDELCELAHSRGLRVHLDGARLFNAAAAAGVEPRVAAGAVDSLTFCFSKGLGAPVGSMIVGSRDFIREARRRRQQCGGAMRQSGILAAAAEVALDESPPLLVRDHERATRLARAVAELPGVAVQVEHIDSNIVLADASQREGMASQLSQDLSARGILCFAMTPQIVRLVTHRDLDEPAIDRAVQAIDQLAAS